jgi:hypothetical protein
MLLKINKLIVIVRHGAHAPSHGGHGLAIGLATFAVGAVLAFGLSPSLRARVMDRFRPKTAAATPEPRVSEWPAGTSRCEGSPQTAWEPEQDGDG